MPSHNRSQPRQVRLQDVVGCATFERFDCALFAYRADTKMKGTSGYFSLTTQAASRRSQEEKSKDKIELESLELTLKSASVWTRT
jgi:hypothetical protein